MLEINYFGVFIWNVRLVLKYKVIFNFYFLTVSFKIKTTIRNDKNCF